MGTTTQAIIKKSEDTINTNKNNTTDADLETHETEETTIAEITANNISTTHISNKENECNTTETTTTVTNEVTAQNIKILPKASPPPQVIIIPTTTTTATNESSTVATNAAKKIRRAFSMPRNPFRWSHKLKTSAFNTSNTHTEDNKTGQDSGGGGIKGGGGGSGGKTALTSITKSYTLSSCVGGKRERADSFVSLNEDNYVPTNTTSNIAPTLNTNNTNSDCKDTQQNQSCITSKSSEKEENNMQCTINNSSITKSSNKKFSTKSNTINGVSNLTNSSTLPTGASLFSTLPAGASNSNHNNNNNNRIFRRSSFRKFLNRITQHMTTASSNKQYTATTANGHTISSTTDRVPPISGYQWPNDQTPGVMGLKNHGNTCFMNAVLQCLSHTDILAEYFVLDQYKADLKRRNKINSRKFGTKGELTEQLANVLKALWTCKNESDHSTSFKAVVDRYGSQFRSSTQHDAQEFLFWLLDKVHEDLNTATKRRYKSVKNNYGRPDEVIAAETLANHIRCNNSFVQAVFQAQFRSSLTCPRCKKQSNTFDPFHCISVQLPQLTQQTIFVTVVYLTQQPRQVRMGLTVTAGSPIMALREQLHKDTGIPNERMVLVDLQKEGFMRVFYDTQPVNTLQGIETIYCIEVPNEKDTPKSDGATSAVAATTTTQANTNANPQSADLLVLVANVKKKKLTNTGNNNEKKEKFSLERFGAPFCLQVPRDCSYSELQKKLLKEMSNLLKPEVFSYATPLNEMFQIRLQDPSADPDTFIEQVEHPLLTEMIDLALSVLSAEAGPTHVKLLLEWQDPETHFCDLSDQVVEHESVPRLLASKSNDTAALTLEQCLEHYTKAETLSAEDAWRCPHCQEYLPVVKTLGLWSLPDILVVHFKRFRQHHGKGANAAKLTTMVNFPLHSFDMSPHLARGVNDINNSSNTLTAESGSSFNRPSPWRKSKTGDSRSSTLSYRDNRETRYDLYAVCYHQGDTLETGHYTAACKNPYDRQWYKFDDQRVSKVSSDSLPEEIVNNEAYMLFYQRRNSENPECSGSSSNSSDHWVSRIAPPPSQSAQASVPVPVAVPVAASSTPKTNTSEEIEKMEAITATTVTNDDIEVVEKSKDSKELDITKPIKDLQTEVENAQTSNENKLSNAATSAQSTKTGNNLDALEKLLDYADADVINEETDDLEQQLEKLEIKENDDEQTTDIFTMDEDCKLEGEEQLENKAFITNNETPKANSQQPQTTLTNGFDKEPQEQDVVDNNNKTKEKTTPTTSSNSSTSSLASQSPAPSSLAISKDAANNLQNKFNGFKSTPANNVNNDKEHLLSSSLKSNSSSIIGSALAGHFSTYRQPWHGSRSSVSAVENATQNSNPVVGQQSTLHLRHSFSTASNYRLRECGDTLSSVLRNSVNTCSKDTLIFLDQQQHHHHHHHHANHHRHHHHSLMEDDDDSTFMGSRSLWISPVTPHKLITVSPKN
ncbi:ubiquitin specific protease 15/31 isoform 2-T2 [Cochliomyia hominivorax]